MEPLIESGKQWVAQWRLASAAARWGFAAAVVASVAGLAFFSWPQSDALVPLLGGDVLASAPLTAAQLTAIEAAFGKAQLNEARVAGRSISVPRSKRHLYLKALVDHKALPAHAYAFTERFLANDHPFSSSRQREEAAKLAKAQEVSLVLQRISGIEEASVLFEDTDLGGFPRRKTRNAVAAVRASGGKPLPATMIPAIRGTVQGTLGIHDAQSITILDLNAGVTHVAAAPSPRERPVDHGPIGTPDALRTADALQASPTGAHSGAYAARSAPPRHAATTTSTVLPADHSTDRNAAQAGGTRPSSSRLSRSPRDTAPAASTSAGPAEIAQAAFVTANGPQPADVAGPTMAGIPSRSGVWNDTNAWNKPVDSDASGSPSDHGASVDASHHDESLAAPAAFDPHVDAVPLTPRLPSTSTSNRMNSTGLDTTALDATALDTTALDTTALDTTALDVFRPEMDTAARPLPDIGQLGDQFDIGSDAGSGSDATLPVDPLDLSLLDARRLASLVRDPHIDPTLHISSRRHGARSDAKHDAVAKAGSSLAITPSPPAKTRSSTTAFRSPPAAHAAKSPPIDTAMTGTERSSSGLSTPVAATRPHSPDTRRAESAGKSSRAQETENAAARLALGVTSTPSGGEHLATSDTSTGGQSGRQSDPSLATVPAPASRNRRPATAHGEAAKTPKTADTGLASEPTGTRLHAATVSLASSLAPASASASISASATATGRRETATIASGTAAGATSSQPFTASVMRPLTHDVQLWVRDNLLTVAGSMLGILIVARIIRSLRATRRSNRAARASLTPRVEPAAARVAEPAANPRSTFHESEPAGRRQLREHIQADLSGAAAALKQWLGNAA